MAQWLRCAEALLRRLLAIEASGFRKLATRSAQALSFVRRT
jgi:hypothetical protein